MNRLKGSALMFTACLPVFFFGYCQYVKNVHPSGYSMGIGLIFLFVFLVQIALSAISILVYDAFVVGIGSLLLMIGIAFIL